MSFLKNIYIVGALALLLVPSAAIAQSGTSSTSATPSRGGILIADVNIKAVVATTTNGVLTGSFLAKSSFGSQEGVVYGFVARSKTDGSILDTMKGEGTLTLPEGSSVAQQFSYILPTYLSDVADVFLTLYTPTGVTLAVHKVAEIAKGNVAAACASDEKSFTCTSQNGGILAVSVFAGSPQGATVAEKSVALAAKKEQTVLFSDLAQDLAPGRYVISGTLTEGGRVTGKVVRDYAKAGPIAKIMSISAVSRAGDGANQVSATVYTMIARFATSSVYTLSMTSDSCGDVGNVTVTKSVTELVLSTACDNGQLTVNLLEDGKVVDSATSTFMLPVAEKEASYALLGWGALVIALLFMLWLALRRLSAGQVASTAVFLFVVAGGMFMTPTPAGAATRVIYGAYEFYFCPGTCGGTNEPAGEIQVQATITYPDSVPANTQYTISLSQSATDGTNHGICQDWAGEDKNCDSIDVKTDVSLNGSAAGSATHVSSVNYTQTAAASGNVTFGATTNPYAPYYIGCDPIWLDPTIKCTMGVDSSENSMSATIPIVSAPDVNVFFSFFDTIKTKVGDIFTVFAAGKK